MDFVQIAHICFSKIWLNCVDVNVTVAYFKAIFILLTLWNGGDLRFASVILLLYMERIVSIFTHLIIQSFITFIRQWGVSNHAIDQQNICKISPTPPPPLIHTRGDQG